MQPVAPAPRRTPKTSKATSLGFSLCAFGSLHLDRPPQTDVISQDTSKKTHFPLHITRIDIEIAFYLRAKEGLAKRRWVPDAEFRCRLEELPVTMSGCILPRRAQDVKLNSEDLGAELEPVATETSPHRLRWHLQE